ncbi:MAG: class I SAM-dependent methyltransferase [Pseudomonadota bacterium]
MDKETEIRAEQQLLWNGAMGQTWVETQPFIDQMLRSFEDVLIRKMASKSVTSVLDVGCGNGAVSKRFAVHLEEDAQVTGIDLSQPMVSNALSLHSSSSPNLKFVQGDASIFDFAAQRFDCFVSRFGVTFFASPQRAFSHLRTFAAKDAELAFVVWRSAEENEFMSAGAFAVAPLLDEPVGPPKAGPGPFALADPQLGVDLLSQAGWHDPLFEKCDVACEFNATELPMFIERLAPLGVALEHLDPKTRDEAVRAALSAYERFRYGDSVRFTARAWLVSARSPA